MLVGTFNNGPPIPPLEWVLARDAIIAFRTMLSARSEKLAGYSMLEYLNGLLHKERLGDIEKPSSGFLAELEHLFRGITGKTGVYPDKIPAFLKYEGIRAAKLRSADLSRMGRTAQEFLNRYACGLDDEVVRVRSKNKTRILKYFGATEFEWEKWRWHTRHIIRDADVLKDLVNLTDEQYKAVQFARKHKIPFGITPYYLSLLDYEP